MKNKILFGAFISGMVLMIFEMVGARIIGPYFGTSMYVWSSIIGVILGSLSLGYWFGGKQADKKSSIKDFARTFIIAAFTILLVLILKDYILYYIASYVKDIRLAAILSGIFLFSIPSFYFGIISPYSIKLIVQNVDETGSTSGKVYAISTLGSIVGTFLGGFLLVPLLGINMVLIICITLMLLAGLLLFRSNFKEGLAILVIGIGFNTYANSFSNNKNSKTYISAYSNITIYDALEVETNRPIRHMMIDNHLGSSKYLDSDELTHKYLKYFRLDNHINPNFKKTLMLGGAACSYPNELIKRYEEIEVDIVEIDEKLIEIAHKDFGLPHDNRLNFFYEDARTYLNKNVKKFDIIYVDAFNALFAIPFQLTTIEAIQKIKNALDVDGAVIVNLLSTKDNSKNHFLRAELATYKKVFEYVYLFEMNEKGTSNSIQNFCLVASNSAIKLNSTNSEINSYLSNLMKNYFPALEILTDEKAPIEFYINKMF